MWDVILAIFLFPAAFLLYLFWIAPEGYEDETGFHLGKKDDNEPRT